MHLVPRFRVALAAGVLSCLSVQIASAEPSAPTSAASPENADCESAISRGRALREKGQLKAASDLFIVCSQPSCPGSVSQECTTLFSETQKLRPSVALVAKDKDRQLVDARVLMDGELLAERLDGRAVLIDPGPHEFRFEVAGRPPVVIQALIAEGEKNKVLVAEFSSSDPAPPAMPAPAVPAEQSGSSHRITPGVYVLGGVAVVAAIGGTTLRLIADSEFRDLERTCKPYCTEDDKSPTKTKYVLSTVAFGVGAAALVSAGVMYLVTGHSRSNESAIAVVPTSTGAIGTWSGRF